jgi:hypothetical protein
VNPLTRRLLISLALAALVVATRLPVRSHLLFDWDAVQYAAALEDYDVSRERPHGPGNPLFILSAKPFSWATGDPALALELANIAFSAIAVIVFLRLAQETGLGRWALPLALALLTNPLFWDHGAVPSAHPCEIMAASVLGLLCWRWRDRAGLKESAALGFSLGIAAGFRPQLGGLLLPLVLWCLIRGRADIRGWFAACVGGAVATLAWAIPMIAQSGGLRPYLDVGGVNLVRDVSERSILLGNFGMAARNAVNGVIWLIAGLGALILMLPLAALGVRSEREATDGPRVAFGFCLAWAVPFLAFHFLSHITRGGFWLPILPPLYLMAGLLLAHGSRLGPRPFAIAAVALNAAFFLFVPGRRGPVVPVTEAESLSLASRLGFAVEKVAGRFAEFTRDQIATDDAVVLDYIDAVRRFDPRSTLVVIEFELTFNWRMAAWYLNEFPVCGIHADGWHVHRPGIYEREFAREKNLAAPPGTVRVAWIGLHPPQTAGGASLEEIMRLPHDRSVRVYRLDDGSLVFGDHEVIHR